MKKILIICNYFAPDNRIAAVRITKIAKYLYDHGYEVIVIAEEKHDVEDEILRKNAEGIKAIYVSNSTKIVKLISFYEKIIAPVKSKRFDDLDHRVRLNRNTGKYEFYPFPTAYPLIGSLDYLVEIVRQFDLFKQSKRYLSKYLDSDYVFTSYGGYMGIFAGFYLHKRNIPWIFDIRDPIYHYKFTPQYVRWMALLFEGCIWKRADRITAVSKGICRQIPHKYWDKVKCVTNGYDKKDREGILVKEKGHNKLRFSYTGSMYGGLQNLSPLFCNIRLLIDKQDIDKSRIEFCFAGKESAYEIFKAQAKKYELDGNCVNYGKITRKEALRLQMVSDVLLVSSFDYQTKTGGIITGKALEYMSANKPIIAIINGDIKNSELGEIIRNANLGFVYEESHHGKDNKALYEYLRMIYKDFVEKGKLEHNPDKQILKKFDYQYLGRKLQKIIESID